jgi:replicative DNA helicase
LLRGFDTRQYEDTILGSLIINEKLYRDVSDMITPEMFTDIRSTLAKAFFNLLQGGEPLRKIKVMRWLSDNNYPSDTSNFFDGLITEYSEDDFLESCVKLRKLYELKKNIIAANNFILNAQNASLDPSIVLDFFKKEVQYINDVMDSTTEILSFEQQIDNTFQDVEDRMKGEKVVGIPTGFEAYDELYGGWDLGNLIIIAAAPGNGKTTLALQYTLAALESGFTCKVFSLEMSYKGLIEKLASMKIGINSNDIHLGKLNSDQVEKVFVTAKNELKKLPLSIWESKKSKDRSIIEIEREIRIAVKRDGAKFFFIDYLGLIKTGEKTFGKDTEYEEIANHLKTIAKGLDIVIILLAQFSRHSQALRQRPKVQDIKYGAEQATDVVISPYTDMDTDQILEAKKTGYFDVDICVIRHRLSGILRDFPMVFDVKSNKYIERDKFNNTTQYPIQNNIITQRGNVEDLPF